MLNPLHSQHGVSMIELMIALVIVGILVTIGAPSLSEWIQNTRIRGSAESILNGLQLARAEAVRRNALIDFRLNGTDTSWCVTTNGTACGASDIQSRSSAEGSTSSLQTAATETDAATNNLAGSAIFSNATPVLTFNGLGRVTGTSLTPGNNANIDIQAIDAADGTTNCLADSPPGAYRCMRILVSSGGQIRICKPDLSLATNPQGCP